MADEHKPMQLPVEKILIAPEVEELTESILSDIRNSSADEEYASDAEAVGGELENSSISVRKHAGAQAVSATRTKKSRSKINVKGVVIITLLALLSVVVLVVVNEFVGIMNTLNSVNYVTDSDNASSGDLYVDKSFVQANVSHSDETKNILLLGCDVDESGTSRSDSIMILSLDHMNQKIKITSLMRDMYVMIPGYGNHKINAAYVYGGGGLTLDTIYSNFGLEIDNYICVDYEVFAEVVDYIGGIDIYLDETQLEQFNKYVEGEENQLQSGGSYHFNGQQVLTYCRIRKADSDMARTGRQREVLTKIIEICGDMSYDELIDMAEIVAPNITTNLTQAELISLLTEGFTSIDYDIMQLRLPIDGTWEGEFIGSIWYMMFDLDQTAQYLNDFIYGDDAVSYGIVSLAEEAESADDSTDETDESEEADEVESETG